MPTFANLPGTTVQIQDQGLRISRPPSGPKVLLLGMTTSTNANATANVPYSIAGNSLTSVYQSFLNADGTPSELCKGLYECYIAGGRSHEEHEYFHHSGQPKPLLFTQHSHHLWQNNEDILWVLRLHPELVILRPELIFWLVSHSSCAARPGELCGAARRPFTSRCRAYRCQAQHHGE